MFNVLLVGAGGFLGCALRYAVTRASEAYMPQFPLGTLVVNAVASLIAGALLALITAGNLDERIKLLGSVGFCGGLSTFSAFSAETLVLLQKHDWAGAGVNAALNLGISLTCVAAGYYLTTTLLPTATE